LRYNKRNYRMVLTVLLAVLIILPALSTLKETQAQNEVVVHLNLKFDMDTLNPFVYSSYTAGTVLRKIYESMFIMSRNGSYIPWLAEKWEISEDAKTYTFYLRKGIKWHDGHPFTSADVAYTFQLCIDYNFHPEVTKHIVKIETPDEYTVRFTLNESLVTFIWRAGTLMIAPKHIWEKIEEPDKYDNPNPIGTGPFKFVEWATEQHVILEKNPDYWQEGKPHIDKIVYHVMPNVEAAIMALKAGQLDVVENVMPNMLGALVGIPNVSVYMSPVINNRWLGFNMRRYPMNLRLFRKAVSIAIDKKAILSDVLYNVGFLGSDGFVMPVLKYWYNPKAAWKGANMTDEERIALANQWLDAIGSTVGEDGVRVMPNGTRLEFDLLTLGDYPTFVRSAEIIKESLEKVGIKINIVPLETGTVIDMVYYSNFDFDMFMMGCSYAPDPDFLWLEFYASPPNPAWEAECENYKNETLDYYLDLQRKTADMEKRREYIFKCQEILADDVPVVVLWHKTYIDAYRTDRFTGWIPEEGIMGILTLINLEPIKPPETPAPTSPTPTPAPAKVPGWVYGVVIVAAIAVIASLAYAFSKK